MSKYKPEFPTMDEWLASTPPWFAKRLYEGMARARERHALSLLKNDGEDTAALRHMQIVRHYEQKAAAIRLGPQ